MMPSGAPKVLIIGGTGFIGQHLVRACLAAGMRVRIADVAPSNGSWSVMGAEYCQGDYRLQAFLDEVLAGMDMVVHLVHDAMVLNLDCNMEAEFERNIHPAVRLMDACCAHAIKKLLFVSSGGTVYGKTAVNQPIPENTPTNPISLYGASKLMIEKIGFLYHFQKGLPFIVARPSNAYGPGQKPFAGQGFVATAIASAIQGRPLHVFGDGSVIRDYIYVSDLVDALVSLLFKGVVGESYNVGTGVGVSLKDILDKYILPALNKVDVALDVYYEGARSSDVFYNVLDISKISNETSFFPKIGLSFGVEMTCEWLGLGDNLKLKNI